MHVANIMTAVIAAVAGLFVGTFATTLIVRVPDDASLLPVGRCLNCGERLRWGEMIPVVSYLRLKGRCAHCGKPYGRAELAVELITAALFGLFGLRFGPSPDLAAYLYLAAVGVVLSAIDLICQRLPDVLTKPSYLVFGGLLAIAVPHTLHGSSRFIFALFGMAGMSLFYFVFWVIKPNGIYWGDVKLSVLLGLALGWLGSTTVIVGMLAGTVFGAGFGLVKILQRQATRKSEIPYGQGMIAGAFLGVLLSGAISLPIYPG